jgi:hypothetical protein
MQIRMIGPEFRLVAPLVPIETRRLGLLWLGRPALRREEVAHDHLADVTDLALLHEATGEVVDRDRTLLGTHLQDALVVPGRFGKDLPFLDRKANGLLGIDVEARLHRMHANQCSRMRRRFDKHGVELFVLDHAAIVVIRPPVLILRLQPQGLAQARGIDIGDGDDTRRAEIFVAKKPTGAAANANKANFDPVVCPSHRGGGHEGKRD